jgi:hypothetical protein
MVDELFIAIEWCQMSLEINFLHLHLDFVPHHFGVSSNEQGKRFHPHISIIEKGHPNGLVQSYSLIFR